MNHSEEIQRIYERLPHRERQVLTSWVRELTEAPEWRVAEASVPRYGASPELLSVQHAVEQLSRAEQMELLRWLDRAQNRRLLDDLLPDDVECEVWSPVTGPESAVALLEFMHERGMKL